MRFTAGSPESLVFGATVEQFAIGNTITGVQQRHGCPPAASTTRAVAPDRGPDRRDGTAPDQRHLQPRVGVWPGRERRPAVRASRRQEERHHHSGAYKVSAEGANNGFNNVGNKTRYQSHEELAGFNLGKLGVQAGYQFVGPYFSAPGYWGKLGAWTNPTNVKGPVYMLKYPVTPKLALNADYEQYRAAYATNDNGTPVVSPLQGRDHVNRYQVGLGYGLSSAYAVDLGYERVEYDLRNALPGTLRPLNPPASRLRTM